jgi:hypothetical protein
VTLSEKTRDLNRPLCLSRQGRQGRQEIFIYAHQANENAALFKTFSDFGQYFCFGSSTSRPWRLKRSEWFTSILSGLPAKPALGTVEERIEKYVTFSEWMSYHG